MWPGRFAVKGVQTVEDDKKLADLGVGFPLIDPAYLYRLMAGGREGVVRTIGILPGQLGRTMRLLQVPTLEDLTPAYDSQLSRFTRVHQEDPAHRR